MCVKQSWIRNKSNGHYYFVKCGHCPACLQEKAIRRANRIRKQQNKVGLPKYDCLFVTLTYRNEFIPYISLSETKEFLSGLRSFLYVYRDNYAYRFVNRYQSGIRLVPGRQILSLYDVEDFDFTKSDIDYHLQKIEEDGLPLLRKQISWKRFEYIQDKVSVCYLPDIQLFIKRLKINLKRNYGIDYSPHYCYCAEYGTDTTRSHLHLLIFVKRGHYEYAKRAVIESWSFGDLDKAKRIQHAFNPAAYLASYVNTSSSVPAFLRLAPFRPFFHTSQGFGLGYEKFSLDSILDMFQYKNFEYPEFGIKDGVFTTSYLSLPTYVLNHYFRKFKGFSRLTTQEISIISEYPERVFDFADRIDATHDECRAISISLTNLSSRYYTECFTLEKKNYDLPSFSYVYSHIWTSYYSFKLKKLLTEVVDVVDVVENYDNIEDLFSNPGLNNSLTHLLYNTNTFFEIEFDPNYFRRNLNKHSRLLEAYESFDKSKKKNNFVLQHYNNYEF